MPPRRVLLVEGNPDAAQMLGDLLALSGHDVTTVGDAPAALTCRAQYSLGTADSAFRAPPRR